MSAKKGRAVEPAFLAAKSGEALNVSVKAAAMLGETPDTELQKRSLSQKPYWHVERARVGNTRKVPVELIVNGESVETIELDADGSVEDLKFFLQTRAVLLGSVEDLSHMPYESDLCRSRRQADPGEQAKCPMVPRCGRRLLER